ncbi:MAG TPA: hypothetical protein VLB04_00025 [Methanotrichaceae archaeon]|nr:hypothetical protein [Methanotrichaceae archaeon]
MNRLEQGSYVLLSDGRRIEPVSLEKNMVGFCARCETELESVAYYRSEIGWQVCARCKGDHLVLMQFDLNWNWLGDQELEISAEQKSISMLPREKLEAVFTAAEIRDMEAFERGEPYVRQNLYRARAKYDKFEKLFGERIDL